jgi:amino-acid N-acetyltransferase
MPAILDLLREAELPTDDLHAESWLHFAVARSADQVVATIGLEPLGDLALLRSMAVHADLRGAGIGRRLLREAHRVSRQLGLKELYLLTTTAELFFAREGFTRIERDAAPAVIRETREFCDLCPDRAVVMHLPL